MEIVRLPFDTGRGVQTPNVLGQHGNHAFEMLQPSLNFQERLMA